MVILKSRGTMAAKQKSSFPDVGTMQLLLCSAFMKKKIKKKRNPQNFKFSFKRERKFFFSTRQFDLVVIKSPRLRKSSFYGSAKTYAFSSIFERSIEKLKI
jgi:hypothetical protein